jgi:hypothetical protein
MKFWKIPDYLNRLCFFTRGSDLELITALNFEHAHNTHINKAKVTIVGCGLSVNVSDRKEIVQGGMMLIL